jgi:hypothetical protein
VTLNGYILIIIRKFKRSVTWAVNYFDCSLSVQLQGPKFSLRKGLISKVKTETNTDRVIVSQEAKLWLLIEGINGIPL